MPNPGQPPEKVDLCPGKPLLSGTNPHPKLPFIPEKASYTGQRLPSNKGSDRKKYVFRAGTGNKRPGRREYHIMGLGRPIPLRPSSPFPTLLAQSHGTGPVGWCRPLTCARRRCPKAYILPSLLSCRKPFPALRFPAKQLSLLNNIECRGTSSPHRELGYIVSSSHFVFIGPTKNENKLLIMKNKPLLQHSTPRISNNYVLRFCNEFVIFVPSFSHADDEIQ